MVVVMVVEAMVIMTAAATVTPTGEAAATATVKTTVTATDFSSNAHSNTKVENNGDSNIKSTQQ